MLTSKLIGGQSYTLDDSGAVRFQDGVEYGPDEVSALRGQPARVVYITHLLKHGRAGLVVDGGIVADLVKLYGGQI